MLLLLRRPFNTSARTAVSLHASSMLLLLVRRPLTHLRMLPSVLPAVCKFKSSCVPVRSGMSHAETKSSITSLLEEYLGSHDTDEARRCLRCLAVPFFHHELVKQAVNLALEHAPQTDFIIGLLKQLTDSSEVTISQLHKGFQRWGRRRGKAKGGSSVGRGMWGAGRKGAVRRGITAAERPANLTLAFSLVVPFSLFVMQGNDKVPSRYLISPMSALYILLETYSNLNPKLDASTPFSPSIPLAG